MAYAAHDGATQAVPQRPAHASPLASTLGRTPRAHNAFTVHSPCAHRALIVRSLCIRRASIVRSSCVHCAFAVHPSCAYRAFIVHSPCAHRALIVRSPCIHRASIVRSSCIMGACAAAGLCSPHCRRCARLCCLGWPPAVRHSWQLRTRGSTSPLRSWTLSWWVPSCRRVWCLREDKALRCTKHGALSITWIKHCGACTRIEHYGLWPTTKEVMGTGVFLPSSAAAARAALTPQLASTQLHLALEACRARAAGLGWAGGLGWAPPLLKSEGTPNEHPHMAPSAAHAFHSIRSLAWPHLLHVRPSASQDATSAMHHSMSFPAMHTALYHPCHANQPLPSLLCHPCHANQPLPALPCTLTSAVSAAHRPLPFNVLCHAGRHLSHVHPHPKVRPCPAGWPVRQLERPTPQPPCTPWSCACTCSRGRSRGHTTSGSSRSITTIIIIIIIIIIISSSSSSSGSSSGSRRSITTTSISSRSSSSSSKRPGCWSSRRSTASCTCTRGWGQGGACAGGAAAAPAGANVCAHWGGCVARSNRRHAAGAAGVCACLHANTVSAFVVFVCEHVCSCMYRAEGGGQVAVCGGIWVTCGRALLFHAGQKYPCPKPPCFG